jgi:hypothetical protein
MDGCISFMLLSSGTFCVEENISLFPVKGGAFLD